mmetsp:Transcript_2325/g.6795  ORF Transcript_2325/g.6795 Transcript_2325/m.6795 type:complete len:496 (+) Transcript_2325:900-2387(+)
MLQIVTVIGLNAWDESSDDPRFPKLAEEELAHLCLINLALACGNLNECLEKEVVLCVQGDLNLWRLAAPLPPVCGRVLFGPRVLVVYRSLVALASLHLRALVGKIGFHTHRCVPEVNRVTDSHPASCLGCKMGEQELDEEAQDEPCRQINAKERRRGVVDWLKQLCGPVELGGVAQVEAVHPVHQVEGKAAGQHNLHDLQAGAGARVCPVHILKVLCVVLNCLLDTVALRVAHRADHVAQAVGFPVRAPDGLNHVPYPAVQSLQVGPRVQNLVHRLCRRVFGHLRDGEVLDGLCDVQLELVQENDVRGALRQHVPDDRHTVGVGVVIVDEAADVLQPVHQHVAPLEQRPHEQVPRHDRQVKCEEGLVLVEVLGDEHHAMAAGDQPLFLTQIVRGEGVADDLFEFILAALLVQVLISREQRVDLSGNYDDVLGARLGMVQVRRVEHQPLVRGQQVVQNLAGIHKQVDVQPRDMIQRHVLLHPVHDAVHHQPVAQEA